MSLDAVVQSPGATNPSERSDTSQAPVLSAKMPDPGQSTAVSEPDEPKRSASGPVLTLSGMITGASSPSTANKAPIIRKPVARHVLAPVPKPARPAPELIIPIVPTSSAPVYPLPYSLNQPIPQPMVNQAQPKAKSRGRGEMNVPEPTYFRNSKHGEYGLRCVCGESFAGGGMVQCDHCDFWLHNMCVNIARTGKNQQFVCPFCAQKKIRCLCGKNMKYDEPLIQCAKCHKWSHKACENLDFGVNPRLFLCKQCGGCEYELKYVTFDKDDLHVPDDVVTVECDRTQLLGSLPEGPLKTLVMGDLDRAQLRRREVLTKYFHAFAPLLFDRAHEFWRVFSDVLCGLLQMERTALMQAIDTLAMKLLYQQTPVVNGYAPVQGLENSEAIQDYLGRLQIQRLETPPTPIPLSKTSDNRVITPVPIDDGAFICDVPGFLIHTDEVPADDGIPLTCMLVTDNELVVDTEGGPFDLAPLFRRSFHFNAIVKLVRISGTLHVGIFAVRMKGPLSEDKSKRGPAIPAGAEIVLPLDGDIPYPVRKCEWKERKQRPKPVAQEKRAKPRPRQDKPIIPKTEYSYELTLLSSFYDESVPPMPFVLLPDQDAVDQYRVQLEIRTRTRSRGRRSAE